MGCVCVCSIVSPLLLGILRRCRVLYSEYYPIQCLFIFIYLALVEGVVDLLDRHVGAREVHVGHQPVLLLGPRGELQGEVGGAAPCAPREVDEQGPRGFHAAEPVHQVLDTLRGDHKLACTYKLVLGRCQVFFGVDMIFDMSPPKFLILI